MPSCFSDKKICFILFRMYCILIHHEKDQSFLSFIDLIKKLVVLK